MPNKIIKKSVVFIFLISTIFLSAVFAETKPNDYACNLNDIKSESATDNFNYERILTPLETLLAGMVICKNHEQPIKLICVLGAGILGVADEAISFFSGNDIHYITWSIFAVGAGRLFSKALNLRQTEAFALDGLIATAGLLLSIGAIENNQKLVMPGIIAIIGQVNLGFVGAVGGLALSGLDEILLNGKNTTEVYDKHYLTFISICSLMVHKLGYTNLSSSVAVGIILGIISSIYETQIIDDLSSAIKVKDNINNVYDGLIDECVLNNIRERQKLALIGGQFLNQIITIVLVDFQTQMMVLFAGLSAPTDEVFTGFRSQFKNFVIFIIPLFLGSVVNANVNSYFNEKIYAELGEQTLFKMLSEDTALRLSYDKNATVSMNNLNFDISFIAHQGNDLVADSSAVFMSGGYGLLVLANASPKILLFAFSYRELFSLLSKYLEEKKSFYDREITALQSDMTSLFENDIKNIRTIAEKDGVTFTLDRLQNIFSQLQKKKHMQIIFGIATNAVSTFKDSISWVLDYALLIDGIKKGDIKFKQNIPLQNAIYKGAGLVFWSGINAEKIENLNRSIERILFLKEKIFNKSKQIDRIDRTITSDNCLIIKNLQIGFDNLGLLSINDLVLEFGRIYALTGKSGVGKTRFLYKIKGVKNDGSFSSGLIQYPLIDGRKPRLVMVSQMDYFPLDLTLKETILYPENISHDHVIDVYQEMQIKELLLDAFGSDNNLFRSKEEKNNRDLDFIDLNIKEPWGDRLSGGEKKKIFIIAAIMKKPDVLILDEAFTGLDTDSIATIQNMIKKNLPTSLILVVDHHAKENNKDFYDKELHFSNKTIVEKDM